MEEFVKRYPIGGERDKKPLQSRCNTLRSEVRRYISHIRLYFRNRPTGLTVQDYYHHGKQNYEAEFNRPWKHELVFQLLKTYQPDYNPEVNNDDVTTQNTQPTQDNEAGTSVPVTMDEDLEYMIMFGSSPSTPGSETSDISRRRRYFRQTYDVRGAGRDSS
ncbi:uncharacterized protein LOC113331567 [Papaver somniferum]|uniref:uncharacterized protein LOC113331567 n=1 Tax=Papaver somniferum TaxID=3469 RepID=UPI000E6F4C3E|nr:uncharacterized protein LOC113331567 [Papaver somniferum]